MGGFENTLGNSHEISVEKNISRINIIYHAEGTYKIIPINGRLPAGSGSFEYVAVIQTPRRIA